MRAMVLQKQGEPLKLLEVARPQPEEFEVLLKVHTCGVCRTDLHIVDGELPNPHLPLILGHQIVATVEKVGSKVSKVHPGMRVGVPWLAKTCHTCEYCLSDRENLCDKALFTGYLRPGGYAEYCTAHEEFLLPLPDRFDDVHAAPLLCAGLIGFRAFRLLGPAQSIGFYGFGSSAHILIQVARELGRDLFVFTRPGDTKTQAFAKTLGAKWAGGSTEMPPTALDGALIFAPVGDLYIQALKAVKKGAKVISAGIHMSDIPSFPYKLLWQERSLSSVANLTRQDGHDFMQLVQNIPLNISVTRFALEEANLALDAIRKGTLEGSAVLQISDSAFVRGR